MNCPSEETLLAAALGELSSNEAATVSEHLAACSVCSLIASEQHQLLAELEIQPELPKSDATFVSEVLARCESSRPLALVARGKKRSLYFALAAMLSAVAVWVAQRSPLSHLDVVTARGTQSHDRDLVTADVLYLRGSVVAPIEQAELHPGDRIAVRYWNGGDFSAYLAVFALDAQNTVHWVFPAYLDASQNPSSIALSRSPEGRVLDEVVEPEKPANGAFKMVALVTRAPLTVRDVEARVSSSHRPLSVLFPEARVQEWSCTWQSP